MHQVWDTWVDANFDDEVSFLQTLVRVPTDTPVGNNAPHAEVTAGLVESHAVSDTERQDVPRRGLEARSVRRRDRRRRHVGHTTDVSKSDFASFTCAG